VGVCVLVCDCVGVCEGVLVRVDVGVLDLVTVCVIDLVLVCVGVLVELAPCVGV